MKFLLQLKAWKLFLIWIVLFMFMYFDLLILIVGLILWTLQVGWIYSIGHTMHSLISDEKKPGVRYFTFSCVCILAYFFLITFNFAGWLILPEFVALPIGLYTMWAIIYNGLFAARMLRSMVEGKLVSIREAYNYFICIWVFPFGVWFIQPAVQKVLRLQVKEIGEGID